MIQYSLSMYKWCDVYSSLCAVSANNSADNWLPYYSQNYLLISVEMLLQSRGCVDRGWDSTKNKPNLSPFTPWNLSPNVETQEETKVAQMSVSVNTEKELKAGGGCEWEKVQSQEKGGRLSLLTLVWKWKKYIFQ